MQYEEFCANIGLRIKYYRQRLRLTQAMLSEQISMDIRYISDIERGKKNITLKTLFKISKALKITPQDLVKFDVNDKESAVKF